MLIFVLIREYSLSYEHSLNQKLWATYYNNPDKLVDPHFLIVLAPMPTPGYWGEARWQKTYYKESTFEPRNWFDFCLSQSLCQKLKLNPKHWINSCKDLLYIVISYLHIQIHIECRWSNCHLKFTNLCSMRLILAKNLKERLPISHRMSIWSIMGHSR